MPSTNDLDRLRRGIADLAPLFSVQAYSLSDVPSLKPELDELAGVIERLSSRTGRAGNVDMIVRRVLRELGVRSIHEVPRLLSGVGYLIDSNICLGVLQVQSDFDHHLGRERRLLGYELMAGYRPHTEIVRELPRSYYERPGYLAPVEDLLDYFAVQFYAGSIGGHAEDGAVGWLVQSTVEASDDSTDRVLALLARECRHWTRDRLNECWQIWTDKVRPALVGS